MKKYQALLVLLLLVVILENIYPETFNLLGNGNPLFGEGSGAVNTAESFLVNPANINRRQSELKYWQLFTGLSDNSNLGITQFCFSWPFSSFGLGIGYQGFNLSSFYSEQKITLALNLRIYQKIYLGLAGINRQITYQIDEYARQDPVFNFGNNTQTSNSKLENAGIYASFRNLAFGYFFGPLNPKEKGLLFDYEEPTGSGASFAFNSPDFVWAVGWHQIPNRYSMAMQKNFSLSKNLTLNLGMGLTSGPETLRQVILSAGIYINNFRLNYYWKYPLDSVNTLGHQILSFGIEFAPPVVTSTQTTELKPMSITISAPESSSPEENLLIISSAVTTVLISTSPSVSPIISTTTPTEVTVSSPEITISPLASEVTISPVTPEITISTVTPEVPKKILPAPQKTVVPEIRTHQVISGETLPEIAEKYYGNRNQWQKIYQANEDKIEKGLLVPGTILIIP